MKLNSTQQNRKKWFSFRREDYSWKLLILLIIFTMTGFYNSNAQSYEHSAGVRLGNTSGLTYKKFIQSEQAIEVLISGRNEGIQLTTTFLQHTGLEFSFDENFYFYYGAGGHVGMERYNNLSKSLIIDQEGRNTFEFDDKNYFVMGIDAVVGLEYRWLTIPMTISFDVKPYLNFIGMRYTQTKFWDAGISFKYVF